jgi:tetratricopeptide (TPR) repeat protein
LALGFLGRIDGSMAAHFGGYATEARTHINEALALDPKSAWAYALKGGWNLEIVRDGGVIGRSLYGASFDKGVQAYRKALELEPGNAAIAYQYAVQLLAAGGTRNRVEARQVLTRALLPKAEDAVERLARRRAKKLQDALGVHDEVKVQAILGLALGSDDEEAARKPLLPGGQH